MMKSNYSLALSVAVIGLAFGADRVVVTPKDTKPFKVGKKDIVRLTGQGIAGSKIEATVTGPARIENTNNVSERVGGSTVIGNSIKEFEVKPTGKGKVKVKITVTPPIPGSTPKETEYEFEVR
jgi:hypothetical protein